jgi:hypothetical protein
VFEVAVPVTLPVNVRSKPSSNVSSLIPSAAISLPSTRPVTVISPVTSIPAPKSTFSSNALILSGNEEPSPVVRRIVLLADVYVKSSTPATGVVFATVILPSASTVKTGIAVAEP